MKCDICLNGFSDVKEGDLVEGFSSEKMTADLGTLTATRA
jgi:uncharacterized protein YuzB (UPF0349 family)